MCQVSKLQWLRRMFKNWQRVYAPPRSQIRPNKCYITRGDRQPASATAMARKRQLQNCGMWRRVVMETYQPFGGTSSSGCRVTDTASQPAGRQCSWWQPCEPQILLFPSQVKGDWHIESSFVRFPKFFSRTVFTMKTEAKCVLQCRYLIPCLHACSPLSVFDVTDVSFS